MLAEAGIHPSEIEVAVMLNRAESDLEVDVSLSGSSSRGDPKLTPKRRPSGLVHVADSRLGERLGIDVSRVKKVEEAAANPTPRPRVNVDERTQLIRTAREETNRGKDPKSRRFVRGVLHDRPFFVRLGCWIVLAFQLSIPLAILAAPLVMLADGQGPGYEWIPSWVVAFPLALPLLGILYFTLSYRVKCRVCGQRVLAPRQCLKNRKAHHIPLLGHIVALALHTVLFHWFNCTYCGTSVRVKE
jgi:hypothetical protein